MKIWTCGSSPHSGSRNAWTRIKIFNRVGRLSNIWNFFAGAFEMIFCRDWWPWTRPGDITKNRRRRINQWSDGITAHHAAKPPSVKICWKCSRLDFFGSRPHPPDWLSSKEPSYQRGVLLISSGAIEGHFVGTTSLEFRKGSSFLHDKSPSNRALSIQKKLVYLGFQCLGLPL